MDLLTHVDNVRESTEERYKNLESNYEREKEKHHTYKCKVLAAREELRASQDEIEKLLTSLSSRIEEETH